MDNSILMLFFHNVSSSVFRPLIWPSSGKYKQVPCLAPERKLDISFIGTIVKIYKTVTAASYGPVLDCCKRI